MNPIDTAKKGITELVLALNARGLSISLTPDQLELAGELVISVVALASHSAVKNATLAGQAAAAKVQTVEDANAVLEVAAAAVESKP